MNKEINKVEKINNNKYDLLITQISTLITDAKRCMRLFYMRFPIFQAVSGILSWSHLVIYCRNR